MESASFHCGSVSGRAARCPRPGRAEDRIGQCVRHRIGVGVTGQPQAVRDPYPAEDERAAGHETMRVVADADAHRHAAAV